MTEKKTLLRDLAQEWHKSADELLAIAKQANMRLKSEEDAVSPAQQQKLKSLLGETPAAVTVTPEVEVAAPAKLSLKKASTDPQQITLRRQTISKINVMGAQGDKKTVS